MFERACVCVTACVRESINVCVCERERGYEDMCVSVRGHVCVSI